MTNQFKKLKQLIGLELAITFIKEVFEYNILKSLEINEEFFKKYKKNINKIKKGEPLHYSIGYKFFYNSKILVNKNVLIPRYETELLIEETKKFNGTVLDICTGSGAIAISLSKLGYKVVGSDISKSALYIAKKNSKLNNVKIKWIHSDMFNNIKKMFDIIVSNPPYLSTKEITNFYEPKISLDGGVDGLEFYRIIAKNGKLFLNKNGVIIIEIGYNQYKKVLKIFKNHQWKCLNFVKDYNNYIRILTFKSTKLT